MTPGPPSAVSFARDSTAVRRRTSTVRREPAQWRDVEPPVWGAAAPTPFIGVWRRAAHRFTFQECEAMALFSKDIKTLDDLFVHQLRDVYYAEKQIVKALP